MSYPPNDIAVATIALLLPLTLVFIAAVKGGLWRRIVRLPRWQRIAAVCGLAILVGYGGDKPTPPQPSARVLELLTVLQDGTLTDIRGRVVSGAQAAALDAFAAEAGQIAAALDQVVEGAREDCIELTNTLAQADYSAAYISLDLPRGTPIETNHNIMVGFERVEQTASNLTALVWFSSPPATNVNVRLQYSIAAGQWTSLDPVTNHWPATEQVGGVECVRYCYAIPPGIAGIPLRPQYEVEFGGPSAGDYLAVPADGITVEVGEDAYLPYTGWDTYGEGEDALEVRYVGGIAVEARQFGETYKGSSL